MEIYKVGGYEITLYGKGDGDVLESSHPAHETFCSVQQAHTDLIYSPSYHLLGKQVDKADALVGNKADSLGVYIADCAPIALLGEKIFAVVHASWRTLHAGIIQKTVKNMCRQGEDVVDISVYMGPCIKMNSYEVGEEFVDYFPGCVTQVGGSYRFDIVAYGFFCLEEIGINTGNVTVHADCTYENNDVWFSHRKGDAGRNFMGVKYLSAMPSYS